MSVPSRIVREGILTSEKVCSLSWDAETFYRRLMSIVDDFGRYYANPKLLRAACYPLQLDQVSDADVGKWLSKSRKAALVSVYEVEGKQYLEILNFKQQVRAKASKFPNPPNACVADAEHVNGGCAATDSKCTLLSYSDSETYSETIYSAEPQAASSPEVCKLPLNDGSEFPIFESQSAEWGTLFPAVGVPQELRNMRAWLLANPTKRKTSRGVLRFVTSWLAREQDKPHVSGGSTNHGGAVKRYSDFPEPKAVACKA